RLRQLVRELDGTPPRLIHAQRRSFNAVAQRLAESLDCPYVITIHDILPKGAVSDFEPSLHFRRAIAVSPTVRKDFLFGSKLQERAINVIPSGVDLPEHPLLPTFGIS